MPATEDPPSHPGAGQHPGPPVGQWAPQHPASQASRSRMWPAIALGAMVLALVATVVAAIALVVATSRPSGSSPVPTTAAPTYSAAEVSAAQRQLCDTYTLGARAVQVDTNGHDIALGRIALTNAAAMLDDAATNPALGTTYRESSHALAESYRTGAAMGNRDIATDAQFQAALDDINAKDAAMKKMCGGG